MCFPLSPNGPLAQASTLQTRIIDASTAQHPIIAIPSIQLPLPYATTHSTATIQTSTFNASTLQPSVVVTPTLTNDHPSISTTTSSQLKTPATDENYSLFFPTLFVIVFFISLGIYIKAVIDCWRRLLREETERKIDREARLRNLEAALAEVRRKGDFIEARMNQWR